MAVLAVHCQFEPARRSPALTAIASEISSKQVVTLAASFDAFLSSTPETGLPLACPVLRPMLAVAEAAVGVEIIERETHSVHSQTIAGLYRGTTRS